MKTIHLPEKELIKMLNFYKNEYERNLGKIDELKEILNKLHEDAGTEEPRGETDEAFLLQNKVTPAQTTQTVSSSNGKNHPAKKAEKPKQKSKTKQAPQSQPVKAKEQSATIKQAASPEMPQPIYKKKKYALPNKPERRTETIINLLKEKDSPLSANDFIFFIKMNFNVEEFSAKDMRLAINKLLNDLVFKNQILMKQYIPSKKTHYYGLKHWFKKNNVLSYKYLKKIDGSFEASLNDSVNAGNEMIL